MFQITTSTNTESVKISMDINSAARLIDSLPVWDKLNIRILTANANFFFYFFNIFSISIQEKLQLQFQLYWMELTSPFLSKDSNLFVQRS